MPMIGQGPGFVSCAPPASSTVPSEYLTESVTGPKFNQAITPGSLVSVDTTLGAVSLVPPASGTVPVGTFFGVSDAGNDCATNNITVGGLSIRIEDPNSPGTYLSSAILKNNSTVVWWVWGPTPGGINGWKVEPSPPLANLANGTADQLLAMSHSGLVPFWFTVGGDVAYSNGSFQVLAISGASPIAITPPVLQWLKSTASPTISQATPTSDVGTQPLTISSQAPFGGASTNKTGANIVLQVPAPVAGGNNAYVQLKQGAGTVFTLGWYPTTTSLAALFVGATQTTSSLLVEGDGSTVTVLNGPTGGAVELTIGTNPILKVNSSTNITLFNSNSAINGGGAKVVGLATATTDPSSTPTGGGVFWERSDGSAFAHYGSGGAIQDLAGSGSGTINTQAAVGRLLGPYFVSSPNSGASTLVASINVSAFRGKQISLRVYWQARDTTTPAAGKIAEGQSRTMFSNTGGTVAQQATLLEWTLNQAIVVATPTFNVATADTIGINIQSPNTDAWDWTLTVEMKVN